MDVDAVCRRLDLLAVEILELMQEQLQVKVHLTDSMKDGYLNLAKARYISGNTSVSALQLPSGDRDLSAQVTVLLEDGKFILAGPVPPESRHVVDGEVEELEKMPNPLQWFGVLVPRNLRQAQNSFRSALEWAVDGTNVQLRLQHCLDQYVQLMKVKRELVLAP